MFAGKAIGQGRHIYLSAEISADSIRYVPGNWVFVFCWLVGSGAGFGLGWDWGLGLLYDDLLSECGLFGDLHALERVMCGCDMT